MDESRNVLSLEDLQAMQLLDLQADVLSEKHEELNMQEAVLTIARKALLDELKRTYDFNPVTDRLTKNGRIVRNAVG